ncbi:MAG: branched-chain amino acid transaminase [Candidatus Portnoybacteria bacterium]|nr:branched-chain amino acid transaminase [Candidatus Portnoybacteria bacterium]
MAVRGKKIWLDGEMHDWDKVFIHPVNQSLHYGLGVFEGLRFYSHHKKDTSVIFRLRDHTERFFNAVKVLGLTMSYSKDDVDRAIVETVRANECPEGYIRPLVFLGGATKSVGDLVLVENSEMGFVEVSQVHLMVAVWPWGTYLGPEALEKGIRLVVVYVPRPHLSYAKICGNYPATLITKQLALKSGYDEGLQLCEDLVAEASAANIFIVKNNRLITPPLTASILPGITRDAIMTIARDPWFPTGVKAVEERGFSVSELYAADECFLCGTAVEVTPVREVDNRTIGLGMAGPITKKLQKIYFKIVHGESREYDGWLTEVK